MSGDFSLREFIIKGKRFGKRNGSEELIVLVIKLKFRSFNEEEVITLDREDDPVFLLFG